MTRGAASRREARRSVRHGESAFSAIEVIIAMGLISTAITLAFSATSTFLKVDGVVVNQGEATERTAAVLSELRSQLASANIVYNPATEGSNAGTEPNGSAIPAGFSMRIYTQLNGELVCVQWRVLSTGVLQIRSWSDLWQENGVVNPWTQLASGILNSSSSPPFTLDTGANYGGVLSSRLIDISLTVTGSEPAESPITLQTSVAARDAEYYPPNSGDCASIPSP